MNELEVYRNRCLNLIKGIDPEWEEFLKDIIVNTQNKRELFIPEPRPMIYQLRNPTVVIREDDGGETHVSGCVWLLSFKDGRSELVVPEETSGVFLERKTGRLLSNFDSLPTPIPDDVEAIIRISLRTDPKTDERGIGWRMYSANVSK